MTKEELRAFIEGLKGIPSQKDIEIEAGLPITTISQILARGRDLNEDQAEKLEPVIKRIRANLKKI